jgi:hypothetical protein
MIEIQIEGITVKVAAADAERLQRLFLDGAEALANQPGLLTQISAIDLEKEAVRRVADTVVTQCASLLARIDGEDAVQALATRLSKYKTPT